jgi:hypothetical protein
METAGCNKFNAEPHKPNEGACNKFNAEPHKNQARGVAKEITHGYIPTPQGLPSSQ